MADSIPGTVSDDPFDSTQGVEIVASDAEADAINVFRTSGGFEDGHTIMRNATQGSVSFIEFRTAAPVALDGVRLFAESDGAGFGFRRAMNRFELLADTDSNGSFETVAIDRDIDIDYSQQAGNAAADAKHLDLTLSLGVTLTAQSWRLQVTQGTEVLPFEGVRLVELDALGAFAAGEAPLGTLVWYDPGTNDTDGAGNLGDALPISPDLVSPLVQASTLSQPTSGGFGNFPQWPVVAPGSFATDGYLTFTVTPLAAVDLVDLRYTMVSYGDSTVVMKLRSSLDGFASDLATASSTGVGVRVSSLVFDLSSFVGVDEQIEFRLYPVQTGPAESDFADLLGTAGGGGGLQLTGFEAGSRCRPDLSGGRGCVQDRRFEIQVTRTDGTPEPLLLKQDSDVTLLGFLQGAPRDNLVTVKVTRGCNFNGNYWVWFGGFTRGAQLRVDVTDVTTGQRRSYFNVQGELPQTLQDQLSFPCD